jgi:DNA-binding CsgD family transcriptional regulator
MRDDLTAQDPLDDLYEGNLQTPFNGTHLGYLFGMVFGVRSGHSPLIVPHEDVPAVAQVIEEVLSTLTPREEKVLRMRLGLNPRQLLHTQQSVANHFAVSRHRIREIENRALRKLRHPSRGRPLKVYLDSPKEFRRLLSQRSSPERLAALVPVIETVRKLEPSLIAHLRSHKDDLDRLRPEVFEHLVAEFLACEGFSDVRLVGRNRRTSADIYAATSIGAFDVPIRMFVEVKRWKDRVGIEVINQVFGALLTERERFGWNAAMIVTVGGFTDTERWTREEMQFKGLILKDREDLLRHLDGYEQSENGLWLPNPRTDL